MIFIPGNVPSSKNSKQWTGKFLVNSKTVNNYKKNYGIFYRDAGLKRTFLNAFTGKPKPWNIGFYFVRDSRRKFDYINMAQIVQDLMVENGWIIDDNCDEIVPVFLGYKVDPTQAGVYISRPEKILVSGVVTESVITREQLEYMQGI